MGDTEQVRYLGSLSASSCKVTLGEEKERRKIRKEDNSTSVRRGEWWEPSVMDLTQPWLCLPRAAHMGPLAGYTETGALIQFLLYVRLCVC